MTNTLDNLLAVPDLDLGPVPTLDDLGVGWECPPLDPAPVLDIPAADAITLDDLAERYRPTEDLVTPGGRGRKPPRWDAPGVLTMLGYLEAGAYRGQAITSAGLAERTVMRWLEIGRDEAERADTDDLPLTFYRHIWQAVMRAEAVPEMRALDTIRRAGERGGWRAAAWFLERRYPDTWGPRATAWEREQAAKREAEAVNVGELDAKIMAMIAALDYEGDE